MRVQTRQPTKIPSQLHPIAEVLARRDFRRNGETAYAEIDEVALAGDFVIEFDALINNTVYSQLLSGNDSTINIRNDDGIALAVGGAQHNFTPSFTRGLFEPVIVTRVGDQVSCSVSGVSETLTIPVVDFNIVNFGRNTTYGTNSPLEGILANLKIWDNSNGSELVVDMPLTKYLPNPNIIENKAKPLGANIVVNGDFSGGLAGWDSGLGSISLASVGVELTTDGTTLAELQRNETLIIGTKYLLRIEVASSDSNVQLYNYSYGNNQQLGLIQAGDVVEILFTAATGNSQLDIRILSPEGSKATLNNIAIRQADGWGQYINPLESDWGVGPYELQWNGDWLGAGLFGPTQIHSSWGENSDGSYTKNSNSWGYLGEAPGNINRAMIVRVKYEIENHQGQMRLYTRSTDNTYNLTKDLILDRATVDINVVNHGMWLDSDNSKGTTVKITSMKEVLKSA